MTSEKLHVRFKRINNNNGLSELDPLALVSIMSYEASAHAAWKLILRHWNGLQPLFFQNARNRLETQTHHMQRILLFIVFIAFPSSPNWSKLLIEFESMRGFLQGECESRKRLKVTGCKTKCVRHRQVNAMLAERMGMRRTVAFTENVSTPMQS